MNWSEKAHVLEESGLGKCDTDNGRRVAECQLANEADGEADPEVVPVPLSVLRKAFGHELCYLGFAGVGKREGAEGL